MNDLVSPGYKLHRYAAEPAGLPVASIATASPKATTDDSGPKTKSTMYCVSDVAFSKSH